MAISSYLLLILKCKFSKIKRQMFTGIIETLGIIKDLKKVDENLHITINSSIANELKIDQSVAHNGVCLTVVAIDNDNYTVIAIKETIDKTNLGEWKIDDVVNLERAMKLGDRLDGHIVQGHVDQTGICKSIEEANGSWYFTFEYNKDLNNITIEKGSITVNGVSLTVVNSKTNAFSVAIIPYTYEHTNFKNFNVGTKINLEFDVIGKYVSKLRLMNL
jgi:riboflavin synthase